MNGSGRSIAIYALWGAAGAALAIASSMCLSTIPVDPILPSLTLGILVAYLCYKYLGQQQEGQEAKGKLLGIDFTIKGAFVVVGMATGLLWWALSSNRICSQFLQFDTETGGSLPRLKASPKDSARVVGYVDGSELKDIVVKLINEDYFHPVLVNMRRPFCLNSAICAQNAGFSIRVAPSSQVPRGTIQICDDTVFGAQVIELTDLLLSPRIIRMNLESEASDSPEDVRSVRAQALSDSNHPGSCKRQYFDLPPDSTDAVARVYGLMNRQDMENLHGSFTSKAITLKASRITSTAPP